MPFTWTGTTGHCTDAKLRVVDDGETFTVSASDGYTITSTLSSLTAFTANPVRSGVGVWSITTKDPINRLIDYDVSTLLQQGHFLSVQKNLTTKDALGRAVLNFTFNTAGTPADLPVDGYAQQFLVHVRYTESNY